MSGYLFQRAVAPGIALRQFEIRDAAPVFAAVDRNREHLRTWLPWVDTTHSAEDIREFILRVRRQFDAGQGPNTGIWVDGVFAGNVGCHPIDWPNRNCSIGYWVDERWQGKGLITRSCAVILDYLFTEARLHRVEIRCGTGNTRSCAIPQRLGFTREGVVAEAEWCAGRWLDLVVWGMLEKNWRARDSSLQ